jgi:glutathione S-transferase
VLAQKSLHWEGIYVDILRGDQFDPAFMKLNPKAVVPTLVYDGKVIIESVVICEYLDEAFPTPPLKPADPEQRAAMRLWTKAVDEYLHPACAELTFASCHRYIIGRLPPEKLNEFLESTPPISVTADWHTRKKEIVRQGMAAPRVERTFRLTTATCKRWKHAAPRTLARRRFAIARRYRHGALCQSARYAGHVRNVDRQPAAAHRMVRADEIATELQAFAARHVSARPHQRPQDVRHAMLARRETVAGGLSATLSQRLQLL